jgi:hypothetical protein
VSENQTQKRIDMKLKVHHPSGDVIAEVYDFAAGALLMSLYGGIDGEGAESYDTTSMVIDSRLVEMGVNVDG